MRDELIRMVNINKSYGSVQALRDVTLEVRTHEIVGLLGDNGAGKSTLIKVLSGAVPVTSGDIFVRGQEGQYHQHHRCHRLRHRDDLPGFGAGHPAQHRPQPVPRARAGQRAALSRTASIRI